MTTIEFPVKVPTGEWMYWIEIEDAKGQTLCKVIRTGDFKGDVERAAFIANAINARAETP